MKRASAWCLATLVGVAPVYAQVAVNGSDPLTELSRMSLEELSKVEVTSVSKSAQTLASAPASIYVITREEILRTGVTSVPEARSCMPWCSGPHRAGMPMMNQIG